MNRFEIMAQENARKVIRELSDFANGMGPENVKAFVREFSKEHRTLQQRIVWMFVEVLKALAENGEKGPGWYDLRNEAAVQFAMKIKNQLNEAFFPLI